MNNLDILCQLATHPFPGKALQEQLRQQAGLVDDWSGLRAMVEHHRIGPLLYRHARSAELEMPDDVLSMLASVYMQRKSLARSRDGFITTLVDAFAQQGLDLLLLKGSALAHNAYPEPALRPMDDLDILIHPDQQHAALETLTALGIKARLPSTARERVWHHWPAAIAQLNGQALSIEVHVRILNRRLPDYGGIKEMRRQPAPLMIGKTATKTLSPEDFLITQTQRLRHHTEIFKLINIADLVGFAEAHQDVVDWRYLNNHHPGIRYRYALIQSLTQLSDSLCDHLELKQKAPESHIRTRALSYHGWPQNNYLKKLKKERIHPATLAWQTIAPSSAWLALGYGTRQSPGSIWRARLITHPLEIVKQTALALYYG